MFIHQAKLYTLLLKSIIHIYITAIPSRNYSPNKTWTVGWMIGQAEERRQEDPEPEPSSAKRLKTLKTPIKRLKVEAKNYNKDKKNDDKYGKIQRKKYENNEKLNKRD